VQGEDSTSFRSGNVQPRLLAVDPSLSTIFPMPSTLGPAWVFWTTGQCCIFRNRQEQRLAPRSGSPSDSRHTHQH
jgi:hypothetical protein